MEIFDSLKPMYRATASLRMAYTLDATAMIDEPAGNAAAMSWF
ncbi:MAG: hypothetical protein ABSE43_01665 [Steroidobacteraceae bacterium]